MSTFDQAPTTQGDIYASAALASPLALEHEPTAASTAPADAAAQGPGKPDAAAAVMSHYAEANQPVKTEGAGGIGGLLDYLNPSNLVDKAKQVGSGLLDKAQQAGSAVLDLLDPSRVEARKQKAMDEMNTMIEATKDPDAFAKDPKAALDRAREYIDAKHDLGGKFDIVDDKEVPQKDRKENQVTDAEFRDIAKRYEDIKHDRSDLRFDANVDPSLDGQKADEQQRRFKSEALKDIGTVMQTRSGRQLIDGLVENTDKKGVHFTTTITPASGFADDAMKPASVGRGVFVDYEPNKDNDAGAFKESWTHFSRPDVALYHELTHAYHASHGGTAGKDEEDRTIGLGDYHDGKAKAEKFNENHYRAERNNITESGRFNDDQMSEENRKLLEVQKAKYPDWEDWWSDGKMKDRPTHSGTPDIKFNP